MCVVVNHIRVKRETAEIHNRMGIPVKRPSIARHPSKIRGFGTGGFCASPNCGYPKTTAFLSKFNEVRTETSQTAASCSSVTALLLDVANTRFFKSALDANQRLIRENTCLMTLQNGAGYETLLRQYADNAHIVIGTTEDNGAVLGLAKARCGSGKRKVASLCPVPASPLAA